MGGSATPQVSSSTSSSTSTSGPNPVIAPRLKALTDDLWGLYERNPTAPAYYPNGTVAQQSAQTVAANTALYDRGSKGMGLGIDAASKAQVADTLSGRYLDAASNPYFQKALAVSLQPQASQLTSEILPNLDAKFAGAGRTGSGAHLDTTMRAIGGLQQSQANAAVTAAQALYNGERDRQNAMLAMLPSLQSVDYQNIDAMARAGATADAHAQRKLDDANAKYRYDQTAQADWIGQVAQRLIAAYPGGQTSGSGTSSGTTTPSSNPVGSALGTTFGAFGAVAPFLPFSDRRLKSDIVRVGRLNDGQPVYRYRLAGQAHPQLGLMAQDVERRDPGAVHSDALGFKHVDYRRATARAVPEGGLL